MTIEKTLLVIYLPRLCATLKSNSICELNGCYWCNLLETIQPPENNRWYPWISSCYMKTVEDNLLL